jgi:hypothetical protein
MNSAISIQQNKYKFRGLTMGGLRILNKGAIPTPWDHNHPPGHASLE